MHLRSKLFFLAVISAATLAAQTPPTPQDETPVFTLDTKLVPLHVSVIDKSGKLITNLPQSAFKVFEDNVEQPLKIFNREDVPVSMGIIIDNSGSMREKRPKVAAAALELIKDSNPQDEVFIVDFNDVAYLDAPFTNNIKKLEQVLDKIDTRGGTAMRDAISMSIDYAKENGKKSKKVLLVITDGNDNTSNETLEQLVRKARQSEVLVYCIGLLNDEEPREARAAKHALNELASISGGLSYYPKSLSEVEAITPQIAHEIRNQYILAYTPTNTVLDGKFRTIKVTVKAPGNPTVRTRNGYFATPNPPAKPKQSGPGDK
jgi:Ca-activated chloride channel family protein